MTEYLNWYPVIFLTIIFNYFTLFLPNTEAIPANAAANNATRYPAFDELSPVFGFPLSNEMSSSLSS